MPSTFKGFYGRSDEDKVDVWSSEEPSQTLQEFKDESDINNLVARYRQTGAFYDALAARNLGAQPRVPIFEDVSEIPDFQGAQEIVARGQAAFEALPPSLRVSFSNSPELFLAFVTEHKNNPDVLRKLGLIGSQVPDDGTPTPTPDITMSGGVQGQSAPANVKAAPQQSAGVSVNASAK